MAVTQVSPREFSVRLSSFPNLNLKYTDYKLDLKGNLRFGAMGALLFESIAGRAWDSINWDLIPLEIPSPDIDLDGIEGLRSIDPMSVTDEQVDIFEAKVLANPEVFAWLTWINQEGVDSLWSERVHLEEIVLDIDSVISPARDGQECAAFNVQFRKSGLHPLFLFNQFGIMEHCVLRRGDAHRGDGWENVLSPAVERYAGMNIPRYFRAGADFAIPGIFEFLEKNDFLYTVELPPDKLLTARITDRLIKPNDAELEEFGPYGNWAVPYFIDFLHKASTWNRERRVIAVAKWRMDELLPIVDFIVTNMPIDEVDPESISRFLAKRGSAEILFEKDREEGFIWSDLTNPDFRWNEALLQLNTIIHNGSRFLHIFSEGWPSSMFTERLFFDPESPTLKRILSADGSGSPDS